MNSSSPPVTFCVVKSAWSRLRRGVLNDMPMLRPEHLTDGGTRPSVTARLHEKFRLQRHSTSKSLEYARNLVDEIVIGSFWGVSLGWLGCPVLTNGLPPMAPAARCCTVRARCCAGRAARKDSVGASPST